jgi:hypothetical protein
MLATVHKVLAASLSPSPGTNLHILFLFAETAAVAD